MEEIIHVCNVYFSYDTKEVPILKDISFTVHEGEWLAIIGHNGSGKSTLAKLLNGLHLPTKGTVVAFNYDTKDEDDIYKIRQQIGLVFQNPENQIVATTVRDDIAFGLENLGTPRDVMIDKINESARIVGLADKLDDEPARLSGGQKQRLAIAGVLACEPKVMIFDEATSMLDPQGKKEVIETMKQLNKNENITIISITHDLNEATLADRIIVLQEGSIAQIGTPKDVFQNGETLRKIGLDLPFAVQIVEKLKEQGIALADVCLNDDELVEEIWKLL